MVRMKGLARSYLWYPGIDSDIEKLVGSCKICLSCRKTSPTGPLISWKYLSHVWGRLHIDFAEYEGTYYLLVVDSYSKWLEVFPTASNTCQRVIKILHNSFASFGIPHEVVSGNGPQFASREFAQFLKLNGIEQTLTPPYHPASDGCIERCVQTLKQGLRKYRSMSRSQQLANFLLMYRISPHTSTGRSQAGLLLKRQPRTRFNLIKPDLRSKIVDK